MATVTALQSGLIILKRGKRGPAPKDKEGNVIGKGKLLEEADVVNIVQGQLYDSSHPVVKMAPSMFGQINAIHMAPVEQATAAPGERRR